MPTQVFINLPVADLDRAKAFYEALGYRVNPQFSNEQAACIVLTDIIHVMLLRHEFFQTFTPNPISDAKAQTEVITCLSSDTREGVDALADAALAAGGSTPREPQDHGFMYGRSFADPDGHLWEVMYMDMSQVPDQL